MNCTNLDLLFDLLDAPRPQVGMCCSSSGFRARLFKREVEVSLFDILKPVHRAFFYKPKLILKNRGL